MSDKDIPFVLVRFVTILSVILLVSLFLIQSLGAVELKIVSKFEFPSDCVDDNGVVYTHLQTWTSTATACDRRTCYAGLLETTKWKIMHDCPEEREFLDVDNCRYVAGSSLSFPDCCRLLQCDNGTAVVDNSAACSDKSSTSACAFWMSETNCTDSSTSWVQALYNLTVGYCRLSCGYCTP